MSRRARFHLSRRSPDNPTDSVYNVHLYDVDSGEKIEIDGAPDGSIWAELRIRQPSLDGILRGEPPQRVAEMGIREIEAKDVTLLS